MIKRILVGLLVLAMLCLGLSWVWDYSLEVRIKSLENLPVIVSSHTETITQTEIVTRQVSNGKDGIDGKDGVGIASIISNPDGTLTFILTSGEEFQTISLMGQDGRDGSDGDDGIDGKDGKDGGMINRPPFKCGQK
jgi:hypothetical protein